MSSPRDTSPVRPSSPVRSHPSTPIPTSSKPPLDLTPSSKVRAMLADSDSDDDIVMPTHHKRGIVANAAQEDVNMSSGSESEAEEWRPRGKIARRLAAAEKDGSSEDDDEEMVKKPAETIEDKPDADMTMKETTPTPKGPDQDDDTDEDIEAALSRNERLAELVAKKRAEREAAEAAKRDKEEKIMADLFGSGSGSGSESDSGTEKLSQHNKPRQRKAGKKAMEQMAMETQRMQRNMQLQHQAVTKKKVTKESLFAKFGFRRDVKKEKTPEPEPEPESEKKEDVDMDQGEKEEEKKKPEDDLPSLEELANWGKKVLDEVDEKQAQMRGEKQAQMRGEKRPTPPPSESAPKSPRHDTPKPELSEKAKGKQKATSPSSTSPPRKPGPKAPAQAKLSQYLQKHKPISLDSDDSDLELVDAPSKPTPQKPIHLIRVDKLANRNTLTTIQTFQDLRQKSLQQAQKEREDKIEELKKKGIILPTAEEKAKEVEEVEDLFEKARKEAERIGKRERRKKAKEEGKDGGAEEKVEIPSSDEEDGDWIGSDVEDLEGSGDEEEGEEEGEEDDEDAEMVDGEATEDKNGSDEEDHEEQQNYDPKSPSAFSMSSMFAPDRDRASPTPGSSLRLSEMPDIVADDSQFIDDDGILVTVKDEQSKRRKRNVVMDEDDEEDKPDAHSAETVPTLKLDSQSQSQKAQAPLFGMDSGPEIGLTQMFEGTIGNSGSGGFSDFGSPGASMPAPSIIPASASKSPPKTYSNESNKNSTQDTEEIDRIPATQPSDIDLTMTQTQTESDLPHHEDSFALSQFPDPTPDQGFNPGSSPAPRRFQTVSATASPAPLRRGKLQRRKRSPSHASNSDDEAPDFSDDEAPQPPKTKNAFDELFAAKKKEKRRKEREEFLKKKSEARGMVEEQAEESEDEFAGLGGMGSDDDDNDNGSDLEDLVNDEDVDVNEAELRGLFAKKDAEQDEKTVQKLFKDLHSGALRKRRGVDSFDLTDSEDELEMRRQAKRRKQAKIRKALLEDDKIGAIAADPKKAAFLSAIEDVDGETEEGRSFLDEEVTELFPEYESQSQSQTPTGSQDVEMSDAAPVGGETSETRPETTKKITPAHPLRKQLHGRAREKASLQKLRSTLSFLSESKKDDEDSDLSLTSGDEADSDFEESKAQKKQNARPKIIDRVEQKRSIASKSTSSLQPSLAFTTTTTTATSTTARLALLRKATTTSSSSFTTEREAADLAEKGVFKKASNKASINFHNREVRRKEVVERKSKKAVAKAAAGSGAGSGRKGGILRGLDKGKFE
ncbi:hypothetical protein BJ508DRAFT_303156 [Ascobolus immersus RN42]|uniref:DNA replication checkpoint mediator MRC1 domain-containing protein n=1 Tax=Ascobolus immersus RN42 TaxID=1160509 RepID=A0A3N4ILP2_ASCIM|nr:hypothetical protein BJ508DRAFT_303156 [Ascobolus immersus RN42]